MKIVNKTCYETADLRAFVSRIAQDELDPSLRKIVTVEIVPSRNCTGSSSGHAFPKRHLCRVRICTTASQLTDWQRIDFAAVIAHELAHLRGMPGGRASEIKMRRSIKYGRPKTEAERERQRELYAWALDLPLRKKQPKKKKLPDASDKLDAIQKAIARWEAKKKRAETALRKYRRKQNYYLKKLAATPPMAAAERGQP